MEFPPLWHPFEGYINDKKEIYFLSTIHEANMGRSGKTVRDETPVHKLNLINDYNKNMGVERNEVQIGNY